MAHQQVAVIIYGFTMSRPDPDGYPSPDAPVLVCIELKPPIEQQDLTDPVKFALRDFNICILSDKKRLCR